MVTKSMSADAKAMADKSAEASEAESLAVVGSW